MTTLDDLLGTFNARASQDGWVILSAEEEAIRSSWRESSSDSKLRILDYISLASPGGLWDVLELAMEDESLTRSMALNIIGNYIWKTSPANRDSIVRKTINLINEVTGFDKMACLEILQHVTERDGREAVRSVADNDAFDGSVRLRANVILSLNGDVNRLSSVINQATEMRYYGVIMTLWFKREGLALSHSQLILLKSYVETYLDGLHKDIEETGDSSKIRLASEIESSLE